MKPYETPETKRRQYEDRKKRLAEGLAPDDLPHGNLSTYRNWGCRCIGCSAAMNEHRSKRLRERTRTRKPVVRRRDTGKADEWTVE